MTYQSSEQGTSFYRHVQIFIDFLINLLTLSVCVLIIDDLGVIMYCKLATYILFWVGLLVAKSIYILRPFVSIICRLLGSDALCRCVLAAWSGWACRPAGRGRPSCLIGMRLAWSVMGLCGILGGPPACLLSFSKSSNLPRLERERDDSSAYDMGCTSTADWFSFGPVLTFSAGSIRKHCNTKVIWTCCYVMVAIYDFMN